jgi:hypothetical protein
VKDKNTRTSLLSLTGGLKAGASTRDGNREVTGVARNVGFRAVASPGLRKLLAGLRCSRFHVYHGFARYLDSLETRALAIGRRD